MGAILVEALALDLLANTHESSFPEALHDVLSGGLA
jgi:hypothetical protein